MNRHRVLVIGVLFTLLFSSIPTARAEDSTPQPAAAVQVTLNGKPLALDPPAFIDSGRTLVPMRAIFEALGAIITWDDATKTVTGTYCATTVKLTIASTTAWVNATQVTLDVPAQLVESRTFVPLRFVAEALGAKVSWDEASKSVIIRGAVVVNASPDVTITQISESTVSGNPVADPSIEVHDVHGQQKDLIKCSVPSDGGDDPITDEEREMMNPQRH